MRRILAAAHQDVLDVVASTGYPGVRLQHLDVFALVPRDEGMRMSTLARELGVTPGAVTQLIDQLERQGLVRRVPDPDDQRATRVVPTDRAEAGYEAGRRRIAELEAEWEARVGPRRWRTFKAVLFEIADRTR
jgi:DNA-binding MarR family transcriptional regulator